jgi:hypothetical protein
MHTPQQLVVRLGEDFNWWIFPAPEEPDSPLANRSVLDPRQLRHVVEALAKYRQHGLDLKSFAQAFYFYALSSEISDGLLQLEATNTGFADGETELFALPVIDDDDGPYFDFIDQLSDARIHYLNSTHQYTHACTLDEMQDELAALDHDRYFSTETMHAFDEVNQILEWSPAEWDESAP